MGCNICSSEPALPRNDEVKSVSFSSSYFDLIHLLYPFLHWRSFVHFGGVGTLIFCLSLLFSCSLYSLARLRFWSIDSLSFTKQPYYHHILYKHTTTTSFSQDTNDIASETRKQESNHGRQLIFHLCPRHLKGRPQPARSLRRYPARHHLGSRHILHGHDLYDVRSGRPLEGTCG